MAELTHILAANTRRQFYLLSPLVEDFQLICFSQRVNATWQYDYSGSSNLSEWLNDLMNAVLKHCWPLFKEEAAGKMTKGQCWIGAEENIGMFSNS